MRRLVAALGTSLSIRESSFANHESQNNNNVARRANDRRLVE